MTTGDIIHQLRLDLWNLTYTQWKTQTLFSYPMVDFGRYDCHFLCYLVDNSRQTALIPNTLIRVVRSNTEGGNGYFWYRYWPLELRHSRNALIP